MFKLTVFAYFSDNLPCAVSGRGGSMLEGLNNAVGMLESLLGVKWVKE